jgi:inhibitor of KinA
VTGVECTVERLHVQPAFHPLGEQAVILSFEDHNDERISRFIIRFVKELESSPFPGFREAVPAFTSVCVYYDCLTVYSYGLDTGSVGGFNNVCKWLLERVRSAEEAQSETARGPGGAVRIPVCYCSDCGLDATDIAERSGLTTQEIAELHRATLYTVAMIGFLPGFPYITGLPDRLHMPRLESPRTAVPAGSVAITGSQTGIYPVSSPGGWRIIGRTPANLFRPSASPPSLLQVGDRVVFEAIDHHEMEAGRTHGIAGT